MGKRFPIPSKELPKLHVNQQEHDDSKELMTALLAHTLREFQHFAYDRNGIVDSKRWKPQHSHEDMNMYRERDVGIMSKELNKTLHHCNMRSPVFSCTLEALTSATVMLTGCGPGRVEDAMSAVVTESQQDLSLVVTYMHHDVADCAVVHTMEHPSDDTPYHYLGYRYFVKKSPTNALVVKHRDSLYLEYCGMTQTRTGETLGFHLMQSVDITEFPDLTVHNSIRALQSSRYLYRQKTDRVVEVFMLGNMDLSGMIVKPIASIFSAGAQFGVTRLLDLAEVRRLTHMARSRRRYRGELLSSDLQVNRSCSQHVAGEGCNVCNQGRFSKFVACYLCGQGMPPTPETPIMGRTFVHQGVTNYPDAVEFAGPCTSPEFEVPTRQGVANQNRYLSKADGNSQSRTTKKQAFDDGGFNEIAMMARLMELTSMAESTSYKTQANGVYLAQQKQMQHQFTMPVAADCRNMGRQDFPLPRRDFPDFSVSPEEHQYCKDLATKLLAHTVHEFERVAYDENGAVGHRRWKAKSTKNDITLYRERDGGSMGMVLADSLHRLVEKQEIFSPTAATLIPPTLLLIGTRQGFVENAMSTLVTLTQDELALVVKFLHGDVADCAVLHTMEGPTASKPFHFLGFKFFVTESAADARIIKRRHSVYLEYTGLTRSRTGEILGYHMMQSVALPQFPDLTSRNSVCAMTSMRFIYRQKADSLVEIFMLGSIDVSGWLIKPMASMVVEDVTFGMTRMLDCSETKRLTQMACEFQKRKHDERRGRRPTRQTSVGDDTCCSVCQRERKGGFGGVKLVPCLVCGYRACSRCRASKQVFVTSNDGLLGKLVKVPVCSICTMAANISFY
ncbi:hypothetical protein PInf_008264 [Phytophthora infestans]|nr:hypothetical protein PInf_008264 [Phytophthora infestans]